MIAIVDYGVGNLYSLVSSLRSLGLEAEVTGDAARIQDAGRIILPGVGAFGDAMARLRDSGLDTIVSKLAREGKPILGVCLGMQLLFERSYEFGCHAGLGLIPGEVTALAGELAAAGFGYKVPHMGWNPLRIAQSGSPIMRYSREGGAVYYVHSFCVKTEARYIVADSEYGVAVTGAVQNGNIFGTQFHPEKSGDAGLAILRAFAEQAALQM